MKKTSLMLVSSLLAVGAMAQKTNVVSAYNYMGKQEYVKAFEFIEKAKTNDKTATEAKTWKYRGDIIMGMIVSQDTVALAQVGEDPLSELALSYKNTIKYDEKDNYTKDIKRIVPAAKNQALNLGIGFFQDKEFVKAYESFQAASVLAGVIDEFDTTAVFNAALAAQNAKMYDEAISMYKQCAEIGYNGAQIYGLMAEIHELQENNEALQAVVDEGRKKYPSDQALILKELNIYLRSKQYDKAESNLLAAIENEPDNEVLYFALGNAYENLEKGEKAIEMYKKAIEVKPDYFDACYNLGAFIFNKGVEYNNAANELDFRKDKAKIDELQKKTDKTFAEAIPYLEKAHEIDPADRTTMTTLSNLYLRMNNTEKYKEIKAKLDK